MKMLALLLAMIPSVAAYPPEVPLFEQTEFRSEYGIFRWYEGCWFRVRHNYAYIICSADGRPVGRIPLSAIPDLIASGILPADSVTGQLGNRSRNARNNNGMRWSAGRLTAAPGDGISLGSLNTPRFSFSGRRSGGFTGGNIGSPNFSGFSSPTINGGSLNTTNQRNGNNGSGFSGFSSVDRFGPRENDGSTFRFSSDNNGGSSGLSGGDGRAGGNGEGALGRPLGIGCDSIDDTKDGGMLGPIPCTAYPGVFGPVPRY